MELDAKLSGIISALLYFFIAWLLAYMLTKTNSSRALKVGLFLAISGLLLVSVPPPIVVLGKIGFIKIANPGHAGINYVAPYFLGGVLAIPILSIKIGRTRTTKFKISEDDVK